MAKDELLRRLSRYTGAGEPALGAIIEAMTYGARGMRNPDPALQPLIPLSRSTYAIAPNIVINNSLERNLLVLLNRLPDARSIYATLSRQKEALYRDAVIRDLSSLGWRYWYGTIRAWGAASEIALAVISDAERCCLILELKSFIAPAEPREIHERSMEIQRGIRQIHERKSMLARLPDPLLQALRIDRQYRISWAVASDTSIGAAYVQPPDVPVVRTSHLLSKLAREQRLVRCCEWLEAGDYLPVEGVQYEVIDSERKIGRWAIEGHGIKCLVDDYL